MTMGTSLGELGRRFSRARSIGGLGFAVAIAVIGGFIHPAVTLVGFGTALYNRAEVYYRNRHPDTPVFVVFVADVIVAGIALLLIGPIISIVLMMYVYVLVTSIFWVSRLQVLLLGLTLTSFTLASAIIDNHLIAFDNNLLLTTYGTVACFGAMTLWMAESAAGSIRASVDIERAALQKEREAGLLKDQFVSMISHELRTPITSLMGFSETLSDSWDALDADETREFLSIIHSEAAHLQRMVEDILLIPGLESGRLPIDNSDFPLKSAAASVIRAMFSERSPYSIQADIPDVILTGDEGRTQQILRNLLRNAQKYGGRNISITVSVEEGMATVRVMDDGAGVPINEQQRIFEAFQQLDSTDSRKDGLGLGLPISRALARAMGGDLWYENSPGATFAFSLPMRTIRAVA